MDGVYKLAALKDENGNWEYKLKLSETAVKISNPGIHQVRRFFKNDKPIMDIVYDTLLDIPDQPELVSLEIPHPSIKFDSIDSSEDLLKPIFRNGSLVYANQDITTTREHALKQTHLFSKCTSSYSVGLEKQLHQKKQLLIIEATKKNF